MKKLCFEYRCEKKRIKEIIKNNKISRFDAFATGSMYVMIRGDKLKLKKKALYQHPLQRVFCGNADSRH